MTIDLTEATDSFLRELDRYKCGLLRNRPILPGALYARTGCTYENDDGSIARSCDQSDLESVAYLLKLLVATAPYPAAFPYLAPLLSGIFANRGLAYCLETDEGAYAMATALTSYLELCPWGRNIEIATAYHVIGLLSEWVKPDPQWTSVPSVSDWCTRLFSAAWCNIALPGQDCAAPQSSNGSFLRPVANLIARDRPPFLPGMVKPHNGPLAVILPEGLDGSS